VKLSIFQRASWAPEDDGTNWHDYYQDAFRRVYEYYAQKFPTESQIPKNPLPCMDLDSALRSSKRRRTHYQTTPQSVFNTEYEHYLLTRMYSST
jgi:hypothetical protein